MRLTALLGIAAASVTLAAHRPHYGGVLRLEMLATFSSLDPPGIPPGSPAEQLSSQVFETLVQLDEHGRPQPWLAVSWTHEPSRKRWLFTPRAGVLLHDGSPWEPSGGVIPIPDDQSIDDILRTLARPQSAVVVHGPNGILLGTGPFRIAKWESGRSATLAAHDGYWGGRPYLDEIRVTLGRRHRDQALDLEIGQADVIEIPLAEARRSAQRGGLVTMSAPVETLALICDAAVPQNVRQALALVVDRASIYSVLLQKQGEVTGALLPQWISGFAFLFASTRDLVRARQLAAGAKPLSFGYDPADPLLHAIANRIVLNAGEAGLKLNWSMNPAGNGRSNVRLLRIAVGATDPWSTIRSSAALLQLAPPAGNLYEAERMLLDDNRLLPLFHLPADHQIAPSLHNWMGTAWVRSNRWRLADVWVRP